KRLREASLWLKDGSKDKFYEEIQKAIWGYLSDKLNIPVSDLTRNSAVESLREKGVSEEEISNLTSVIDTCEFTRFAPSSSDSEASNIYEDASRFIRYVENSMG
ncbi:MAG: protein BatD, partial [Bacteroidales bacterium]